MLRNVTSITYGRTPVQNITQRDLIRQFGDTVRDTTLTRKNTC